MSRGLGICGRRRRKEGELLAGHGRAEFEGNLGGADVVSDEGEPGPRGRRGWRAERLVEGTNLGLGVEKSCDDEVGRLS